MEQQQVWIGYAQFFNAVSGCNVPRQRDILTFHYTAYTALSHANKIC